MPDLAQVEAIAARVKYDEDIARCIGIRPETLARKKKLYAQFNQAILNGRAKGALQAGERLMSWMLSGEQGPGPLFFYLKFKCGWGKPSESESHSISARAGLSTDLVGLLREELLSARRSTQPAQLIEHESEPVSTTATDVTIADKRAELLGRNGKNHED